MIKSDICAIINRLGGEKAPLLQVLLLVQEMNPKNYISENDVNEISRNMKVSRSRVYSTASFYSEISLKPRGRHLIRVCVNAPCENAGKTEIMKALEKELLVTPGETTRDGLFTLETVNCLGACNMSPAIRIDDNIYGDLTPEKVGTIIREIREASANAGV